jgi:hypothetical protein
MGRSKSLIYQLLWSYEHKKSVDQTLPVDSCVGLKPESASSLGISTEYIGPGVLAQQGFVFGVLAQVTKAKPTVRVGRASKSLTVNEVWSHPPGSNWRPADYEE